jgi:large-conductance mechanosensitive channel
MEDECFGLPNGGAVAGVIFGTLILLIGFGNFFGWSINFGAFIMIIIGLLIIAGAIYGLVRKKS